MRAQNHQEALANILYFPKSTVQSTAISSFANSKASTKRFTKSRSTSKKRSNGTLKIVDQSETTKGDWYGLQSNVFDSRRISEQEKGLHQSEKTRPNKVTSLDIKKVDSSLVNSQKATIYMNNDEENFVNNSTPLTKPRSVEKSKQISHKVIKLDMSKLAPYMNSEASNPKKSPATV